MTSETTTARPTVCLSLDFDAVCVWMANGARDARSLSRGEFGARVGARRLLDLCDTFGIPSTWFVPGHTAETFPAVTAEIAARGHELANHGYLHEDFSALSPDQVRAVLRKSNDALERVAGQRPRGIRIPPWAVDAAVFELLIEEGFTYDSSLMDDCRAHWCRGRDTVQDDGPNIPGPDVGLVELPISFITSDFAYFEFNGYGTPNLPAGLRNPRDVEQIWCDEFDYMVAKAPDTYVMLMLHPQSIGWGGRMLMLERVLAHFASTPGVRFVTAETIADEFRQAEALRGPAA
jgi:peptidoglycan/xylan/chitin deacetylase (PgdA/CDA1 family)